MRDASWILSDYRGEIVENRGNRISQLFKEGKSDIFSVKSTFQFDEKHFNEISAIGDPRLAWHKCEKTRNSLSQHFFSWNQLFSNFVSKTSAAVTKCLSKRWERMSLIWAVRLFQIPHHSTKYAIFTEFCWKW